MKTLSSLIASMFPVLSETLDQVLMATARLLEFKRGYACSGPSQSKRPFANVNVDRPAHAP